MPSLVLLFYQGWNETQGKDELFEMDENKTYDDTQDASVFFNDLFGASFNVYNLSGNRVAPAISLTNVGVVAESKITWTATTPVGTTLLIDVSLDGNNWTNVPTSGQSIPVLYTGQNVVGKSLYVRQRLTTTNDTVTPSLTSLTVEITPGIEINNDGDLTSLPEVWIKKVGNGDASLVHVTNGNRTTTFTGIVDGETIYINSDAQDIATDIDGIYRFDNFNDTYPELKLGQNIFKVNGDAKITFKYQYKLLQG